MGTELHRGRLVDHVHLVVKDLAASHRFYAAVFEVLGIPIGGGNVAAGSFWADEIYISSVDATAPSGQALSATGKPTGWVHLAFQASDQSAVDRFYVAALAAGGRDNGPPGLRPYHPGYYAAFVLDPDDNNVEVVHHGPANRSAPSVKITF